MKTCSRKSCQLQFLGGSRTNEYCCGPCRRGESRHSQKCGGRRYRASENDTGFENETASAASASSASFVYDARIPLRYHYQQESVYHAICLCMTFASEAVEDRRKFSRRLLVAFHPDKTNIPNAHEITVMLNEFAEWYNDFAPM